LRAFADYDKLGEGHQSCYKPFPRNNEIHELSEVSASSIVDGRFARLPIASRAQVQLGIQGGSPPIISVSGPEAKTCQIQWTDAFSDDKKWHHLATMVITGAPVSIPDTTWGESTSRYYRAVETPAENMVFIPEGSFILGDSIGDGEPDEQPTNLVFISSFFIDQYEVTNEKMREVMQWAYDNGRIIASSAGVTNSQGTARQLLDLNGPGNALTFSGSQFVVSPGKGQNPCVYVTWYGAAAYCNYRSEQESKPACYNLSDWSCDFAKMVTDSLPRQNGRKPPEWIGRQEIPMGR